jgi:hypothetical protein
MGASVILRAAAGVACGIVLAASALAKPGVEADIKGEVLSYGIYREHGGSSETPSPTSASGRTTVFEDFEHLATTSDVPLQLGTVFGFEYELRGLRPSVHDRITIRALHPAMRGADGKTYTDSTTVLDIEPEDGTWSNYLVYRFSEKRELVRGRWVLQVLHDGKLVVFREFAVH